MTFSRAHTSAEAKQSPLIHSTTMQNQTHGHVTIILQNLNVTWGMICLLPNRNLNPNAV